MIRKTMITAGFAALLAVLPLGSGIFLIPPAIASAAAANSADPPAQCRASDEALANFVAAGRLSPAPETPFQDAAGAPVRIADAAKPGGAVVNFWATWCAPCIREMPQLDALKADLAKDGIPVLAISQDRGGLNQVKPFYEKHGYKHLEIHLDQGGKFARALKIRGLPTTILFDALGREVVRVQGLAEWDSPKIATFIRQCLSAVKAG